MSTTGVQWAQNPDGSSGKNWNPIRGTKSYWFCTKVGPECFRCYAEQMSLRFFHVPFTVGADVLRLDEKELQAPLHWRTPQVIFVSDMSDLFHERVPDEWLHRIWEIMGQCPQHRFLLLTKRTARAAAWSGSWWPHLWLGTSVGVRARLPHLDLLRRSGAQTRFVSFEPLLEDLGTVNLDGMRWVIVGGESGAGFRPMRPEWVRGIREQCVAARVPFFFKQWGGLRHDSGGRLLDGREWNERPAIGLTRRVQRTLFDDHGGAEAGRRPMTNATTKKKRTAKATGAKAKDKSPMATVTRRALAEAARTAQRRTG